MSTLVTKSLGSRDSAQENSSSRRIHILVLLREEEEREKKRAETGEDVI